MVHPKCGNSAGKEVGKERYFKQDGSSNKIAFGLASGSSSTWQIP
jgi:hypothetical protein